MTNALSNHDAKTYFNSLNNDYLMLHRTKEDLFWSTYMGTNDDHAGFAQAESALNAFISSSARISDIKDILKTVNNDKGLQKGLAKKVAIRCQL